jgi:2-(acetamidomethylene)succinate hydrolase
MTETYLASPVGPLFALESGEGDLVVLLHGVSANAYVFVPLIELLSARHRVVALDQRGHGRSPAPPDGQYGSSDYAGDLAAAIRSLDCGPATVVGHSLGARNAVVAGATIPALVAAVVAVDFTPFIAPRIFDALEARVATGARNFHSDEEVREYLTRRYPGLPRDAVERRAVHGYAPADNLTLGPLARADAIAATCAGLREDLETYVLSIDVPALFVRGAESAFVTPEAFEATKSLRPDLAFSVVDGADHYVPEEQPGPLAEMIEDFLTDAGPSRAAWLNYQERMGANGRCH